tara:strand:- start:213 stop:719 length:507 start_codon:yes stop_codon:yes gene_type:complete
MAVSTVVKVRRDGEITLTDGGAVALVISYEDGNFSANNLAADEDRVVIRDRGTIVGLRKGDDQVGTLSFTVHFREFTNASSDVLLDFLNGSQGVAGTPTALTSTGGSGFEQFLCTAKLKIEGTDLGDGADPVATFSKVLFTADFSEGDPDTLSVSGEVYGGVVFAGTA